MIKYFQKLQAKKGFTLVELIVVIAIIGVLAAILIPTMLGYVTSSRVTSANSTAASIKNSIDNFLTDADTAGYGMLQSKSAHAGIKITVDDNGWKIQVANTMINDAATNVGKDAFKSNKTISWTAAESTVSFTSQRSGLGEKPAAQALLALQLKDLFPEIKSAAIACYLEGGKCMYVAYTADCHSFGTNATDADFPAQNAFSSKQCSWNGTTAGVSGKGFIVGTAPALSLGGTEQCKNNVVAAGSGT